MIDKSSGTHKDIVRLVDISFNCNPQFSDPKAFFSGLKEGFEYIQYIKDQLDVQIVEHTSFETKYTFNGVPSFFFKGRNKFFHIPIKTLRHLKKLNPDVILCQGITFPVQVLAMRMFVPRKTIILAQHHGERPFKGIKKWFQKLADRYIDGYLFTALGNTKPWTDQKIIKSPAKCHELLEASTFFTRQDKSESMSLTGMQDGENFLWVGRLEKNKDPLTVLRGFGKYLEHNNKARLYMIYQTNELEQEVKALIQASEKLPHAVTLVGKIDHGQLSYWFSAADYYLSGSHREGSGYALLECMACGCIPVVSDIPPFRKITGDGKFAKLYIPGNTEDLFEKLKSLDVINVDSFSEEIHAYFKTSLSFKTIADNLVQIVNNLMTHK